MQSTRFLVKVDTPNNHRLQALMAQDAEQRELSKQLVITRQQHAAWQLLASRRAPLIISCLQPLLAHAQAGIALEDAQQALAAILAEHANQTEFDISGDDYPALARRELRAWIRRGLLVERDNILIATDALAQALKFVDGLQDRIMTSTASRLGTVQREIENLETRLTSDPETRAATLKRKMLELEGELQAIQQGKLETLPEKQAIEGIREVYNLAMSLRADFRRVEDSYREADRALRQSIISEQQHRGDIVDKLLDSHDALLETPEGQVFHGFHAQLNQRIELEQMQHRLRNILRNPMCSQALSMHQQTELRWLIGRLVIESRAVIRARSQSEKDVKGFIKTGLAAEHHRVGQLLNTLFETAVDIDWQRQVVRRTPTNLPAIAIAAGHVPLSERLRYTTVAIATDDLPDTVPQHLDLDDVDKDFWDAFDALDQYALMRDTCTLLQAKGSSMRLSELCTHLPPTHDLETLAVWLKHGP